MGRSWVIAVIAGAVALLGLAGVARAELYAVEVRRIDQDC